MELILPASKTNPFLHGIRPTIAATNDVGCPIAAMKKFRTIDSHRPKFAPFFCIARLEQRPFTREHVIRNLQELAIMAGLGTGVWNGHSFHSGAATWAASIGIADTEIQTFEDGALMPTKYILSILEPNALLSLNAAKPPQVHRQPTRKTYLPA